MEYRKMVFDGVSYNCFTDEELEAVKHQYYLDQEQKRIEKNHAKNTVSSKEFKKEYKERYGL